MPISHNTHTAAHENRSAPAHARHKALPDLSQVKPLVGDDLKRVFLISDTHFDHKNIMHRSYCDRPFDNVGKMNRWMTRAWNQTVKPEDTLYFLGDMAHGKNARSVSFWRSKLNGILHFIVGNHDKQVKDGKPYEVVDWNGRQFLLTHYPEVERRPVEWNGWVIHGHMHNNDMLNYPFINGKKKTINVCVEMIGYRPLSVHDLLALDLDSIRRMDTALDEPQRF